MDFINIRLYMIDGGGETKLILLWLCYGFLSTIYT